MEFGKSAQRVGMVVPANLISKGISTLFCCVLTDPLGRGRIILASLFAFLVLTDLTESAKTVELLTW